MHDQFIHEQEKIIQLINAYERKDYNYIALIFMQMELQRYLSLPNLSLVDRKGVGDYLQKITSEYELGKNISVPESKGIMDKIEYPDKNKKNNNSNKK